MNITLNMKMTAIAQSNACLKTQFGTSVISLRQYPNVYTTEHLYQDCAMFCIT